MDIAQEVNACINIPSSRTFRSYSDNEIRQYILTDSTVRSYYRTLFDDVPSTIL
jgi:hypothetical protein